MKGEERQEKKEGPSHNQSESDDDGDRSSSSAKPEADEVGEAKPRKTCCGRGRISENIIIIIILL